MSKRNITAPLSPDVTYDTDEDGTKMIIRKFDIPLPSKHGKTSERKLEKWKYQHDVPEGKIFTKRVHADLSSVTTPQNVENVASNISATPISSVLQTTVPNIQVIKTLAPIRKDVIVVPPNDQSPKVLAPVPKTLCSDKITLNNLPDNVITNSIKVFDSKFVNGRKVLYLKAVKDVGKVVANSMKSGTEVILTQSETSAQQLKCVAGTSATINSTIKPIPLKPSEVKCMYPSKLNPNTTDEEHQGGTPISKLRSALAQKLKFTSREVPIGNNIGLGMCMCNPKKSEVQVNKPISVIVPATVPHSKLHTLPLPPQNKREVVMAAEVFPRIRSGIVSNITNDVTNNGREITLQINPASKTNSHILIDTSKQKVNLAEGNISVVGVEFLNNVPNKSLPDDNSLLADDQSVIKESKLTFVPADSTTPSIVTASPSVPQHVENQISSETLLIVNQKQVDAKCLDTAVIESQKQRGVCNDPKNIPINEGKTAVQNVVIMNPTQNLVTSNASIIRKPNIDEIMRRKKIALKFQQDMQRAREMPRIERTIEIPARKVNVIDSSTQTSLFCMLEPGRMVEMFLNEDSYGPKISKVIGSHEKYFEMKEQNHSANEKNHNSKTITPNTTDLSKVTTDCQTATNDQMNPPLPKRIRLDLTNTEPEAVKGRNETYNNIINDNIYLPTSMDFEDLMQPPFESMGKENILSTNMNVPPKNNKTSACDIQNNINNNNSMPLACMQSTLNANINCIEESVVSNYNTCLDNQVRSISNKEMIQRAFKDYCNSLIRDEDGNLPLHNAVMDRDVKQVQRQCLVLTAQKQSIDVKNMMEETALHLAVLCHDLHIVKILLKYKARPDLPDSEGNTPLHMAIIWGNNIDILKVLLTCIQDNNPILNLPNDEGLSPLHLCALHNKSNEALLLVKRKADVNIRDRKSGRTPLFHAVENGNAQISRVLMEAGAHTNIQNFSGQTALNASELTMVLDSLSRNIDSQKTSKPMAVPCLCQDETKEDRTSNVSHNKNISGFERIVIEDVTSNDDICDINLLDRVFDDR